MIEQGLQNAKQCRRDSARTELVPKQRAMDGVVGRADVKECEMRPGAEQRSATAHSIVKTSDLFQSAPLRAEASLTDVQFNGRGQNGKQQTLEGFAKGLR